MRLALFALALILAACTGGVPDSAPGPDAAPAVECPAAWDEIPWTTASDPPRPGFEDQGGEWIRVSDDEFAAFVEWRHAMVVCGCTAPPEIVFDDDLRDPAFMWWRYGGPTGFAASMDWIRDANGCAP